jgi:hypothetical protein
MVVHEDDAVAAGEKIADIGARSRRGPHLHYVLTNDDEDGCPLCASVL